MSSRPHSVSEVILLTLGTLAGDSMQGTECRGQNAGDRRQGTVGRGQYAGHSRQGDSRQGTVCSVF